MTLRVTISFQNAEVFYCVLAVGVSFLKDWKMIRQDMIFTSLKSPERSSYDLI